MNILVLGSGGREFTLAWKISYSIHCEDLYIAPGNAGTSQFGENVDLDVNDFKGIGDFVIEEEIDLVVVGPEDPLVNGIRDYFESHDHLKHVLLVGPGKEGAQLEGSKDFSKAFMQRHNIPTAKSATFTEESINEGLSYLENCSMPIVLKADGLAAGKGVVIAESQDQAKENLKSMLIDKQFGQASAKVLIEEFLDGIELSFFILTDGTDYIILPEAKDYKRIGEGDTGPNTGGMGAVSPVKFATKEFLEKVKLQVVEPTINGLKSENISYKGFLFIGLMKVGDDPYVIEYNVRMGDPETQVVIPRIKSDLVELLEAAANGTLNEQELVVSPRFATTVVLVSEGYPGKYEKGKSIQGLADVTNGLLIHAGTKQEDYETLTDGGRVMAVTGAGDDLEEALSMSYKAAKNISWEGIYYRKDIGKDILSLRID